MTKEEAEALLDQVKANKARLDACVGSHSFRQMPMHTGVLFKLLGERCSKCGGEVGTSEALWYKRGLAHGRG